MAFRRKQADPVEIVIDAEIAEPVAGDQAQIAASAAAAAAQDAGISPGPADALPVPRGAALPAVDNVEAVVARRSNEVAIRTVAVATAGGVVAGAATVALVKAAQMIAKPTPGLARRRRRDVVASRSFMVDVHLLKPQR